MVRFACGLLVVLSLVGCTTRSGKDPRLEVYGSPFYYEWTETQGGEKLLDETGLLYAAGVKFRPGWVRLKGEFFGGVVEYDGQTQAGTTLDSDTTYVGGMLEADFFPFGSLLRPKAEPGEEAPENMGFRAEPYLGLGLRFWSRDLDDATDDEGNEAYGYREAWSSTYAHTGVDLNYRFGSGVRLFSDVRFGYSLYNRESVDLDRFGLGEVVLHPEPGPRVRGELGLETGGKRARLRLTFFGEYVSFRRSDWEETKGIRVRQPTSDYFVLGVTAGVMF